MSMFFFAKCFGSFTGNKPVKNSDNNIVSGISNRWSEKILIRSMACVGKCIGCNM